jgi:glutaminyl-peptide cyclotransferase
MNKLEDFIYRIILLVSLVVFLLGTVFLHPFRITRFNAQNAFLLLAKLQSFGPRIPDSSAHVHAVEFITCQLQANGWNVQTQSGLVNGHAYTNLYAKRSEEPAKLLLGTHYDSRMKADRDPNPLFHNLPVPGANDGGSSTAVLLELSRILPQESSQNVGLVFFDLEDQGDIKGWDWILGSREFVRINNIHPETMILLDMVGGHVQTIQPPKNSDQMVYQEIQAVAKKLGYEKNFINSTKFGIYDDHVPFLEAGIHSIDLIDINDPYWHTVFDDLENVSIYSLERVGDTLTEWILAQS